MSNLTFTQKNAFDFMSDDELKQANDYCEEYKNFLNKGKTERLCVSYAVKKAVENGFTEFEDGKKYKAGDKIYLVQKNHSVILAVIGTDSPEKGFLISAGHIDSPRIDIKPSPLYEDNQIAYLKTHYYGGLRKYQWVTIPLQLCGVICKKDGSVIDVNIGGSPEDPVFYMSDLLPHLAKDQRAKALDAAFEGESMNIIIGSQPTGDTDGKETGDKVKSNILKLLNDKYGITEEDFLCSELCVVPAMDARDVGLDRSMIASYGHDDRVCSYPCLTAILAQNTPAKTCVAVLTDKEEIGSVGITGLRSDYLTNFLLSLCEGYNWRKAFANSAAISADVSAAFDPCYPGVFDKKNSSFINCGPAICKYTGHGGKSGASDAQPEFMAKLCGIFDSENVLYQFAELGKVDQGGGGTVSQYLADRNIEVLDIGVAMISMHAPYELAAKTDVYMLDKLIRAFYKKA